ncbi:30S ribosomal protein S9 [Pseudomonadota bacterium]
MPAKQTKSKTKTKSKKAPNYIYAVGRRKRAIARVRLYPRKNKKDKGLDLIVNSKQVEEYFHNTLSKYRYTQPLRLTNSTDKYSITAKIIGSGPRSQLDALIHGISRALIKNDEDLKPVLKKHGLLTRDPRKKQRRMIGTGGKARRQKQSPKR